MSPGDIFILAVRWIHTIAAVAWVGGSLFYLVVLRPVSKKGGSDVAGNSAVANEFRSVVDTAVMVLIITGVVLAFDRLTSKHTDVTYVSVLGVKVALTLWMFWLAGVLQKRRRSRASTSSKVEGSSLAGESGKPSRALSSANLVAIIGIVVFLISDLLQALFEDALKAV
ncbi:MAG: hypothetical protein FI703_07810 [SAR202 cluster bacterium]|nr:hypothetical protein [SAR202 cluster bacterium]